MCRWLSYHHPDNGHSQRRLRHGRYAQRLSSVPTGGDTVFTDPMTGEYQIKGVEHSEYQVTVTAYLQGYDTKVVS